MNKIYNSRIKFYADTPAGEKNKYFCFKVGTIFDVKKALYRFINKGFKIRAAYYEKLVISTGKVIENSKIDMDDILEKYVIDNT